MALSALDAPVLSLSSYTNFVAIGAETLVRGSLESSLSEEKYEKKKKNGDALPKGLQRLVLCKKK